MSSIFSSFFQVAGAKPFSEFLNGNKKTCKRKRVRINKGGIPNQKDLEHNKRCEKNKKTKRRSLRKTVAQRKKARRTSRRTSKINKPRNLTKRKFKGKSGKYECVTCNKGKKGYFTGKEPSPKGLGYCARCTPLNITMKGKDGNLWEIKKYSKGKRWVRV